MERERDGLRPRAAAMRSAAPAAKYFAYWLLTPPCAGRGPGELRTTSPQNVALVQASPVSPQMRNPEGRKRSRYPAVEAVGTGCRLGFFESFLIAFSYPIGNFCVARLL